MDEVANDAYEEALWRRLEVLAKEAGREDELELMKQQRLVELQLLLPAGLARRLHEEARALGYGTSDFLSLLLDYRYKAWLPPAARRAWRRELRSRRRW